MKKTKLPKPKIKYNNGIGTILCNKCNTVIKDNLTKDDIKGEIYLIYCVTCAKQEIENFIKNYNS